MTLLRPGNPSAAAETASGPAGAAGAIRLEELPAALPRLSPQEGIPKEMLEAAPFRCYSLTGPPGVCGPRCGYRIASFPGRFP